MNAFVCYHNRVAKLRIIDTIASGSGHVIDGGTIGIFGVDGGHVSVAAGSGHVKDGGMIAGYVHVDSSDC